MVSGAPASPATQSVISARWAACRAASMSSISAMLSSSECSCEWPWPGRCPCEGAPPCSCGCCPCSCWECVMGQAYAHPVESAPCFCQNGKTAGRIGERRGRRAHPSPARFAPPAGSARAGAPDPCLPGPAVLNRWTYGARQRMLRFPHGCCVPGTEAPWALDSLAGARRPGEGCARKMASKPLKDDPTDEFLEVGPPKTSAVGIPSLLASIPLALNEMGPQRALKTLLHMNHKDGFDCMSCAWPDPPHRKVAEFCENGAKAVSWEADPLKVPALVLGGALGDGAARAQRILAGPAGAAGRAGVQAGRAGPLPARSPGTTPSASSPASSTPWPSRTRRRSTPAGGPATRPPSPTSCSCGPSAPTTSPTARTCATSRRARP